MFSSLEALEYITKSVLHLMVDNMIGFNILARLSLNLITKQILF